MRAIAILAGLAAILVGTPVSAMTASFSWSGIPRCSGTSPAFSIGGAPKGTATLRFAMRDYHAPNFSHGGGSVSYSGARVPAGAISYIGPCPPPNEVHRYIWTIDALDASGAVLATTQAEGRYP